MSVKDIVIGDYYRHKNTPNYAWAKPLRILQPHEGLNKHNYIIVECEWSIGQGDLMGMIKYFKASDLVRPESEVKHD
jgi:hypothetical protein